MRVIFSADPINRKHDGTLRETEREFYFDDVLDTDTDQQTVFDAVAKPLVDHVFEGFNACCFAYGQTGAGKTYSTFGEAST